MITIENVAGTMSEQFQVCLPCKMLWSEAIRSLWNGILTINGQKLHVFYESKLVK